jgi:hypothetical protein
MSYGENGGAVGTLIGEENRGLACMFTMMNNARLLVGTQGVAIAEAACQHALAYAKERKQGRPLGSDLPVGEMAPIIEHPDIRRMLLTMKAMTEASRALCYATAVAIDGAHAGGSEEKRRAAQARADLLTPIAKSFSTDAGVETASIGVQIHGGMGFIEETGAAQFLRDARILPIYEGTNGIQAIDLVTRKLPLGNGDVARSFIAEMRGTAKEARSSNDKVMTGIGAALDDALDALDKATDYMLANLKSSPNDCLAGATPYLRLFGTAAGGHYLTRAAMGNGASARREIAQFYAANILPGVHGLLAPAMAGAESLLECDSAVFAD